MFSRSGNPFTPRGQLSKKKKHPETDFMFGGLGPSVLTLAYLPSPYPWSRYPGPHRYFPVKIEIEAWTKSIQRGSSPKTGIEPSQFSRHWAPQGQALRGQPDYSDQSATFYLPPSTGSSVPSPIREGPKRAMIPIGAQWRGGGHKPWEMIQALGSGVPSIIGERMGDGMMTP
ncbi:hypothetical protein N7492_000463 [Penicillium capsulatum]|uniref:Uncharacterized protein n=1 Tax=Penicillium capsulatum TaxID=69766 RepID=A0A9W9IRX0_9EURO|nr:hypothetical protein N7492_000463 [Penicillium capsulatum]